MSHMPPRKLNAGDVEDLRIAYEELMEQKSIVRPGPDGPITITTTRQLAAWKGIGTARFFDLRRDGWKLKRGVSPAPPTVDGDTVSGDAFRTLYEMSIEQIKNRDRRIAELEAELAALKKETPR